MKARTATAVLNAVTRKKTKAGADRPVPSTDPTRTDPTKTALLRRRFASTLSAQFAEVKRRVSAWVLETRTLNAFCPTGKGGGVDPTCGARQPHPTSMGEAVDRYNEVAKKVFFQTGGLMGHNKFEMIGGRFVTARVFPIHTPKGDDIEESYAVRVDFGVHGREDTSVGKSMENESLEMLRKVKQAVKAFHQAGFKIEAKHADDRRKDVYTRWLKKMGLNPDESNKRKQNIWNVFSLQEAPTGNALADFESDYEAIKQFEEWLRTLLASILTSYTQEQLWRMYVEEGFRKGAGRSFDDVSVQRRADLYGGGERLPGYDGTREQFLSTSFNHPVSVDKVKILARRAFGELLNVTTDAATRVRRTLTDGLVQGKSPRDVARDLVKAVGISKERALTVARTEIIRAHAEGQLTALKKLGVEEIGVMVEWSTSGLGTTRKGNPSPCPVCAPLKGVVLKIDEASGLLPRHPNCLCSFTPANVGEDQSKQKRTAAQVTAAVAASKAAAGSKRGKATKAARVRKGKGRLTVTGWAEKLRVSPKRPKSIVENVFCATGQGGGVDPTCGKDDSGWSEETYYHGSNDAIASFQEVGGRGVSFTPDRGHAESFGGRVHEVKLRVKNPIDLTRLGSGTDAWDDETDDRVSSKQVRAALAEYGVHVDFGSREVKGFTSAVLRRKMDEVVSKAEAKGYDAILLKDYKDFEADEVVVFSPKQVKLLTENVFCATGAGGGVDPTCSPGGGRTSTTPLAPTDTSREPRDYAPAPSFAAEFVAKESPAYAAARGRYVQARVRYDALKESEASLWARLRDHATDSPESDKIRDEWVFTRTKLTEAQSLVNKTVQDLATEARFDLLAMAVDERGGNWIDRDTSSGTRWTTGEHEKMFESTDFVGRLLAREHGPVPKVWFDRTEDGRAYYKSVGKSPHAYSSVHVSRATDTAVYVHELGHHVENHVPGAREAATAFLKRRTGDEPLTNLRERFGSGFTADEVGRKDDWGKLFPGNESSAYYVGKHYAHGDTEVVSMGLELLYRDPKRFAQTDPEYFDLVVGILQPHRKAGGKR